MGIFTMALSLVFAFGSGYYYGKSVEYPPQPDEDFAMGLDITARTFKSTAVGLGIVAAALFIGGLFLFAGGR